MLSLSTEDQAPLAARQAVKLADMRNNNADMDISDPLYQWAQRQVTKEAYKDVAGPSLADMTAKYIGDTYSDMLILARISDTDKILTILYDMWHSCIGQQNSPDCTSQKHEAYYQALARYFRDVDISTIRKLSAQAKNLVRRPVENWTLSHKPNAYRPLP